MSWHLKSQLRIKFSHELVKSQLITFPGCKIEPIENSSANVTSLLRHNATFPAMLRHNATFPAMLRHNATFPAMLRHGEAVEFRCDAGYVPEGVSARRCERAKLHPLLSEEPFKCTG